MRTHQAKDDEGETCASSTRAPSSFSPTTEPSGPHGGNPSAAEAALHMSAESEELEVEVTKRSHTTDCSMAKRRKPERWPPAECESDTEKDAESQKQSEPTSDPEVSLASLQTQYALSDDDTRLVHKALMLLRQKREVYMSEVTDGYSPHALKLFQIPLFEVYLRPCDASYQYVPCIRLAHERRPSNAGSTRCPPHAHASEPKIEPQYARSTGLSGPKKSRKDLSADSRMTWRRLSPDAFNHARGGETAGSASRGYERPTMTASCGSHAYWSGADPLRNEVKQHPCDERRSAQCSRRREHSYFERLLTRRHDCLPCPHERTRPQPISRGGNRQTERAPEGRCVPRLTKTNLRAAAASASAGIECTGIELGKENATHTTCCCVDCSWSRTARKYPDVKRTDKRRLPSSTTTVSHQIP